MDAIIEKLLNEDKMQKQQEIEDKITNVVDHPTKIYAFDYDLNEYDPIGDVYFKDSTF